MSLLDYLQRLILSRDEQLRKDEQRAAKEPRELLVGKAPHQIRPAALEESLKILDKIAEEESDRETSLNSRGAALATVAGLIVAFASAVVKASFGDTTWTGWTKQVAAVFFLIGLTTVAWAMAAAVVMVLRPHRGAKPRNFLARTISDIRIQSDGPLVLLTAEAERLRLLRLDRALRTLPALHYRNRFKARWLRRSYMLLLFGTLFIGAAGIFALSQLSRTPYWVALPAVAAGTAFAGAAVSRDWVHAVRRGEKAERFSREEIVQALRQPWPAPVDSSEEIQRIATELRRIQTAVSELAKAVDRRDAPSG